MNRPMACNRGFAQGEAGSQQDEVADDPAFEIKGINLRTDPSLKKKTKKRRKKRTRSERKVRVRHVKPDPDPTKL